MLKEAIPRFDEMTSSKKLQLLEELRERLAAEDLELPVPEWHKAELERRYQEYLETPGEESTWEEVKADCTG